jgi:hypothetical protein
MTSCIRAGGRRSGATEAAARESRRVLEASAKSGWRLRSCTSRMVSEATVNRPCTVPSTRFVDPVIQSLYAALSAQVL